MTKTNLLAAFIGGVAAGAVIGLLVAPRSGADSRKKIKHAKNRAVENMDDMIGDIKESWVEKKGQAKKGMGIAVDEMDDFMRLVLKKGQGLWNKAKSSATELKGEAVHEANQVIQNGKRAEQRLADATGTTRM